MTFPTPDTKDWWYKYCWDTRFSDLECKWLLKMYNAGKLDDLAAGGVFGGAGGVGHAKGSGGGGHKGIGGAIKAMKEGWKNMLHGQWIKIEGGTAGGNVGGDADAGGKLMKRLPQFSSYLMPSLLGSGTEEEMDMTIGGLIAAIVIDCVCIVVSLALIALTIWAIGKRQGWWDGGRWWLRVGQRKFGRARKVDARGGDVEGRLARELDAFGSRVALTDGLPVMQSPAPVMLRSWYRM